MITATRSARPRRSGKQALDQPGLAGADRAADADPHRTCQSPRGSLEDVERPSGTRVIGSQVHELAVDLDAVGLGVDRMIAGSGVVQQQVALGERARAAGAARSALRRPIRSGTPASIARLAMKVTDVACARRAAGAPLRAVA